MTVFGTTLDVAQIAALVGLLVTLALWLVILGRERGYVRWFKGWKAGRDADKIASRADRDGPRRGPWG